MKDKGAWIDMNEEISESIDIIHDGEVVDAYNRGLEAARDIVSKYKQYFVRTHARWIPGRRGASCSNCHFFFRDVYDLENYDNYCRHCGAIMDGFSIAE